MTHSKILKIKNRIDLLSTNGKENHNIIRKLKRQLKNIEKRGENNE